MTKKGYPVV